jgi:hypothetical protein
MQPYRGEHPPRLYTFCKVRGISHQGTGVDETCNQEHLKKMVVPLLCKCFKQRNKRHIIKTFRCRLKDFGYGDLGISLVSKPWGKLKTPLTFRWRG